LENSNFKQLLAGCQCFQEQAPTSLSPAKSAFFYYYKALMGGQGIPRIVFHLWFGNLLFCLLITSNGPGYDLAGLAALVSDQRWLVRLSSELRREPGFVFLVY
jgi:hypothetical protein